PISEAVAVAGATAAVEALGHLKEGDLGRAGMLVGGATGEDGSAGWPTLPDGAVYAVDVIDCPAELRPAVVRLLRKRAIVDDLDAAAALVAATADVVAITRDGDLVGAHFVAGGSNASQSLIEVQAALDEATAAL